jgi:hypothetical protein
VFALHATLHGALSCRHIADQPRDGAGVRTIAVEIGGHELIAPRIARCSGAKGCFKP